MWKLEKLEKKFEKLRKELENLKKELENLKKELENLKKLEKLKPYALLIIGGRASRSTTLRNPVYYEL